MATAAATDVQRAVALFHALSDETRLAILELLRDGERCVCELQESLDVAQSRLSFHLKTLKDAGLVTDRRDGRWIHYALDQDSLEGIAAFVQSVHPGKHAGSCARACCP